MKRSLLIMLLAITSTVVAAQASTKCLSAPQLLPDEAGILSVNMQQTVSRLSFGDSMGMLVARATMPDSSSQRSDTKPQHVSGREPNPLTTHRVMLTEETNTKDVLIGDEEQGEDEDEDEGEDGKDEKEGEGEDEGGERMWNAPELG